VNRSEANDSDEFSGGPPPIYVLRSRVYCAQKAHRNRRLSSLFSHASRRDPRIVRNRRARRSATRRSSTETIVTENLDVTEPRGTREWPARLQRTRAKFGSCPRPYFVPGAANASIAPQTPCTSLVRVSNESRSLRSERRKTLLVHRRAPLALSAYGTEPTCQADGDARPMRAQSLMRENLDAQTLSGLEFLSEKQTLSSVGHPRHSIDVPGGRRRTGIVKRQILGTSNLAGHGILPRPANAQRS